MKNPEGDNIQYKRYFHKTQSDPATTWNPLTANPCPELSALTVGLKSRARYNIRKLQAAGKLRYYMPIYEYTCADCRTTFEVVRLIKDADTPIPCSQCKSEHTARIISVFYAHSGGKVVAGCSSGCAGCAGGSCASCAN